MSIILRSLILALLLSSVAVADTGSVLLTDLRFMLGQTTASNSNWTDAELYRTLNMATNWIAAQGRVLERSGWIAGGAQKRGTPLRFIKLRGSGMLWRNGVAVKPVPLTSLDSLPRLLDRASPTSAGMDVYYMVEFNDSIIVAPTLNAADSVQIFYYARDTTLAAGVECGYGVEWEHVLLYAAKVIALQKINSPLVPLYVQERDKLLAAMYQQKTLKPQLVDVP